MVCSAVFLSLRIYDTPSPSHVPFGNGWAIIMWNRGNGQGLRFYIVASGLPRLSMGAFEVVILKQRLQVSCNPLHCYYIQPPFPIRDSIFHRPLYMRYNKTRYAQSSQTPTLDAYSHLMLLLKQFSPCRSHASSFVNSQIHPIQSCFEERKKKRQKEREKKIILQNNQT